MKIALIKSFSDKPWRSPETYRMIEESLREKWVTESVIAKNPACLRDALFSLKKGSDHGICVFNIAEYLDEQNKTGFLPSLLDQWGLPHLGSPAEVVALGLDKERTKECLRTNGIPTPRYFVARNDDEHIAAKALNLDYPMIVKPCMEGGHIGISDDSIVYDAPSLGKAIRRIRKDHNQPALVEEYISGQGMREFSVGIIAGETKFLTPIEIDFESMGVKTPILSFETAAKDLEKIKLMIDDPIHDEIVQLAERTFTAVGAMDYSRVDIRMDARACYVLEINIMPGLGPHSFIPEAIHSIYGMSYSQLIQKLAENSIARIEHTVKRELS